MASTRKGRTPSAREGERGRSLYEEHRPRIGVVSIGCVARYFGRLRRAFRPASDGSRVERLVQSM